MVLLAVRAKAARSFSQLLSDSGNIVIFAELLREFDLCGSAV